PTLTDCQEVSVFLVFGPGCHCAGSDFRGAFAPHFPSQMARNVHPAFAVGRWTNSIFWTFNRFVGRLSFDVVHLDPV
ncbi:MAG: hypothetical protein RJA39_1086, partial [Pseudomonadota bacterium]